jgi:hypothetical protein
LSVEASLRVEPDSGRTDTAPSINFHLGASDVVPFFQHSADQDVEFSSVSTINCTEHTFHRCILYCLLWCFFVVCVFLIFFFIIGTCR